MKNLFVPQELAFVFRQKGFNEPCVAWYDNQKSIYLVEDGQMEDNNFNLDLSDSVAVNARQIEQESKLSCSAPTYQQAVNWFIEKHNIHPCYGSNQSGWYWNITKTNGTTIKDQSDYCYFKTHYEALNKAIEEAFKLI